MFHENSKMAADLENGIEFLFTNNTVPKIENFEFELD